MGRAEGDILTVVYCFCVMFVMFLLFLEQRISLNPLLPHYKEIKCHVECRTVQNFWPRAKGFSKTSGKILQN